MSNLEPGDTIYIHFPSSSLSSKERVATLIDRKNENTLILSFIDADVKKYQNLTWNGRSWILKNSDSIDDDGEEVTVEFSKRTQVIQSRLREEPESSFTQHYLTDLLILIEASMKDFPALVATNRQMYYLANNSKFENQLYRPRFIKHLSQYLGKDNEQYIALLDRLINDAKTECFDIFLDAKEKMLEKHYCDATSKIDEEGKKKYAHMTCEERFLTLRKNGMIAPDSYLEDTVEALNRTYDELPDEDREAFQICSWKDIYGAYKIMWDLNIPSHIIMDFNCANLAYADFSSQNKSLESRYLIKLLFFMEFLMSRLRQYTNEYRQRELALYQNLSSKLINTNNYCLVYLFFETYYFNKYDHFFSGCRLYDIHLYIKIQKLDEHYHVVQSDYIQSLLKAFNLEAYSHFVYEHRIQKPKKIRITVNDVETFFSIQKLSDIRKLEILNKFEKEIEPIKLLKSPHVSSGELTPQQVEWLYLHGAHFGDKSFMSFLRSRNSESIVRLQELGVEPGKKLCKDAQTYYKNMSKLLNCT